MLWGILAATGTEWNLTRPWSAAPGRALNDIRRVHKVHDIRQHDTGSWSHDRWLRACGPACRHRRTVSPGQRRSQRAMIAGRDDVRG